MKKIDKFKDEYRFLSNFYPCPFIKEGILYKTAEHYYQANKAAHYEDIMLIVKAPTPGDAKRLGRSIETKSDWDNIKLDVMKKALEMKFIDTELSYRLLKTGDAILEEGNNWGDTFWGVCNGVGENHLGKLLMELREVLFKTNIK